MSARNAFLLLLMLIVIFVAEGKDDTPQRFLLYDVNPGEGFNLRRDVYLRMAVLVSHLNALQPWTLVLPPWSSPYHWRSNHLDQERIPWFKFFDIQSLNKFVPVLELHDFPNKNKHWKIDEVIILQHFDFQENSLWEEKLEYVECNESEIYYWKEQDNKWRGRFWNYANISASSVRCMALQGLATTLIPFLIEQKAKAIMLDRAEVALHHAFGDVEYWAARRSMRFARNLVEAAHLFRKSHLNSSNESDNTVRPNDWKSEEQQVDLSLNRGGPYIGVHLRRKDFVTGRAKDVPSINSAAKQIEKLAKKFDVGKVFVASDGTDKELIELRKALSHLMVHQFQPTKEEVELYLDGGVAIIEQIICSHARAFIGTYESTFSFRIQEEREIMGFHPDTTFQRLCGDDDVACEQPSRWRIQFD
ncbi:GDP-fucose protein O-fucosyltransferase 2 [Neocloeon triangulifer]|uniref:GDP-fucose protein O-fucosyltransferase 2 n=1 Tax=Neocloeon triangulifer TaxID=2078957 RepID=UPI00286EE456|nr:GDP-fucose protein O-fucosyltransferase 2 [Neocloeon triangulifer]